MLEVPVSLHISAASQADLLSFSSPLGCPGGEPDGGLSRFKFERLLEALAGEGAQRIVSQALGWRASLPGELEGTPEGLPGDEGVVLGFPVPPPVIGLPMGWPMGLVLLLIRLQSPRRPLWYWTHRLPSRRGSSRPVRKRAWNKCRWIRRG